jgi:quercetin dioxygenase-like cupin family protein
MKTMQALENLAFSDQGPFAQQIHMDEIGKIVRYTLKPGQELEETHAPFIPRNFIVLKGTGSFKSAAGEVQHCGPGTVIVFERKEENIIQALEEELVVIGFLYWAVGG